MIAQSSFSNVDVEHRTLEIDEDLDGADPLDLYLPDPKDFDDDDFDDFDDDFDDDFEEEMGDEYGFEIAEGLDVRIPWTGAVKRV
ncbi:MAG: hypothetical protein NTY19_34705 [Planctomycetota bacterium]|nr:hypothetical protein [Planctomycetota bacterium]